MDYQKTYIGTKLNQIHILRY